MLKYKQLTDILDTMQQIQADETLTGEEKQALHKQLEEEFYSVQALEDNNFIVEQEWD